jgi:hypothetical protein
MPSFTLIETGQTQDFLGTIEQFSDQAGVLEKLTMSILLASNTAWGALFGMVTPQELTSIRVSKNMAGASTVTIDLGGGAGVGALDLSDVGLDSHHALLVELQSEAPVGDGRRVARGTFWFIPGT